MKKLKLVREEKLYKLLPGRKKESPLEASGVAVVDGYAYVIFDSLNLVGMVNPLTSVILVPWWLVLVCRCSHFQP